MYIYIYVFHIFHMYMMIWGEADIYDSSRKISE